MKDYRTFAEAGGNLERFIEGADNAKRFHSHPGYLPPNVFAEAMAPSAAFAYAVVRAEGFIPLWEGFPEYSRVRGGESAFRRGNR